MKMLLVCLAALLSFSAHSAISPLIEWDIQSTGSDTNGCGFKAGSSGTDYSQVGATPHVAIDGTTITAVVQATTTDLVVTGYTVATTDVGNVIQIASGATAGFYEIQSVNTGTSTWTLDRSAGTAAQSAVAAMGGSCATPNKIMSEATALAPGHVIHIKSGTYSRTSTITLAVSGSASVGEIQVRGYNTSHGDITTWAGMSNAPVLTSATNSLTLITSPSISYWKFRALKFTHTGSARGTVFARSSGVPKVAFDLVLADGVYNLTSANTMVTVTRSEIKNTTDKAIISSDLVISDSWVHSNLSYGIQLTTNGSLVMTRTVVDHNTTAGISITSPLNVVINSSVIACNTGNTAGTPNACGTAGAHDGLQMITGGGSQRTTIANSIFWGNGQYNWTTGTPGATNTIFYNAWGGAGTGNVNTTSGNPVTTGISPITLTADPFAASGSGDFSLNSAAGGGALLKSLGYPGAFPGGTMTGYNDVGAIHHQDAAGGGGGSMGGVF